MSELWGFQSGQSQRQADDQSKGLYALGMAEGALKIETQKFALDNAKLMQSRQEQAIKMMQLAQPGTPGVKPTDDPTANVADVLYKMGGAEIESGLLEQGADHIKQASTLQENHQKIVNQTTADKIKKYDFAANLLNDVHDQSSWDQMKLIYQSQFNEQLDPKINNQPYSPQLIDMLKAGAQTSLQKANQAAADARAQASKATIQLNKVKTPYYTALTAQAAQRTKNLAKTGAAGVLPKAADTNAVARLITSRFDDVESDKAHVLAGPIAEEAARMIKEDNIPPSEAYARAYNHAKNKGDFWGLKPKRNKAGSVPEKPIPVPMKDGKVDVSKMSESNQFYEDPSGQNPGVPYVYNKATNRLIRVTPEARGSSDKEDDKADNEEDDE